MSNVSGRLLSLFLVFTVGLAAPAAAQFAPIAGSPLVEVTGAERTSTLAAVSKALQSQTMLKGDFVQVGADGRATQGKFYLKRPGRIRFEYDAPAKLLVVADGSTVAIQDNRLKTFNRAPLKTTPLYFFLKENIDLTKDAKVLRVAKQDGTIAVSVKDKSGQTDGILTLLVSSQTYSLRQWLIEDGLGGVTRVALNDVERPASIDPKLFILRPSSAPVKR